MPELSYSSHTVLPDGVVLLAVLETRQERRLLRTVERSETVAYVFKHGYWWGPGEVRVTDNRTVMRLSELYLAASVRASVDAAVD